MASGGRVEAFYLSSNKAIGLIFNFYHLIQLAQNTHTHTYTRVKKLLTQTIADKYSL